MAHTSTGFVQKKELNSVLGNNSKKKTTQLCLMVKEQMNLTATNLLLTGQADKPKDSVLEYKKCSGKCQRDLPSSKFGKVGKYKGKEYFSGVCKDCRRDRNTQWRHNTSEARSKSRKEYYRKLKDIVFKAYGDKCACCGETLRVFLAIDHVNNDGNTHRKKVGRSLWGVLLEAIRRNFPADFQLLCHNCNAAKAILGQCPHALLHNTKEKKLR
jgi:hypothetical protein